MFVGVFRQLVDIEFEGAEYRRIGKVQNLVQGNLDRNDVPGQEDRPIGVMARILLKEAIEAREGKGEQQTVKKSRRER